MKTLISTTLLIYVYREENKQKYINGEYLKQIFETL